MQDHAEEDLRNTILILTRSNVYHLSMEVAEEMEIGLTLPLYVIKLVVPKFLQAIQVGLLRDLQDVVLVTKLLSIKMMWLSMLIHGESIPDARSTSRFFSLKKKITILWIRFMKGETASVLQNQYKKKLENCVILFKFETVDGRLIPKSILTLLSILLILLNIGLVDFSAILGLIWYIL